MLLLQEQGGEHGGHGLPGSIFTWLWKNIKDEPLGQTFRFNETKDNYGQIWFETLCFSIMLVVFLSIVAIVVSRKVQKVPRGGQNFFEFLIEVLTKMLSELVGPEVKAYMPYLFTLFVYIFCMNAMGLIPAFRSPTMNLSTTAALGIVTFLVVQGIGLKHNGILGYFLHFTGKSPIKTPVMMIVYVMAIAPLMTVIHIVGTLAQPTSLSARLFGNMFADDTGIEQLLAMGSSGAIPLPLQAPLVVFGILVSMVQAIVFTTLTAFYIKLLVAHEEEEH